MRRLILALLCALTTTNAPAAGPLSSANADRWDIPPQPLFLGIRPPPNFLFLMDDSNSMYSMCATEHGGCFLPLDGAKDAREGGIYGLLFDVPLKATYVDVPLVPELHTAPSQQAIDKWHQLHTGKFIPAGDGVWRFRNADYNKLYFDPDKLYLPWEGVDAKGLPFGNIDPRNAPWDPYDVESERIDLTKPQSFKSLVRETGGNYVEVDTVDYFIPRYYTWDDLNSNGLVDEDDGHSLVEISTKSNDPTLRNFANWFSYYRNRLHAAKAVMGTVIAEEDNLRAGFATIHNNQDHMISVKEMSGNTTEGNKQQLLSTIYGLNKLAVATPISAALKRSGDYFRCRNAGFYESFYSREPGKSGSAVPIFREKQNMFGEKNSCPLIKEEAGGACQQNAVMMLVDGGNTRDRTPTKYYGTPNIPELNKGDEVYSFNEAFDGAKPINADGDNNSAYDGSTYGDSYAGTLADVAMHNYETDLSSALDGHQSLHTYVVGMGLEPTVELPDDEKTSVEWPDANALDDYKRWVSPNAVDDLLHSAHNGRGLYANAMDDDIVPQLQGILRRFTDQTRIATSITASSSNLLNTTSIYIGTYNTEKLSGSVLSLPVKEDGSLGDPNWDAGKILNEISHASRNIITFDPLTRKGISFDSSSLSNAIFVFGELFVKPPSGADKIFEDPLLRSQAAKMGLQLGLTKDEINYIRGDRSKEGEGFRERSSVMGPVFSSNPVYVGKPSFDYPQDFEGSDYTEFRERYANRPPMVYVAANDGMLHGFDAETGKERFAYLPAEIMRKLKEYPYEGWGPYSVLDGWTTVIDAYVRDYKYCPTGTSCWRTILVGGYGAGGQGYYALDVTDPEKISRENADALVMWEFGDPGSLQSLDAKTAAEILMKSLCSKLGTLCFLPSTSNLLVEMYTDAIDRLGSVGEKYNHPGMGYSIPKANVVRLANGRWYAVVGNGFNNTEIDLDAEGLIETAEILVSNPSVSNDLAQLGFDYKGEAYLYLIDLATGVLEKVFNTEAGSFITPEEYGKAGGKDLSIEELTNPSKSVLARLPLTTKFRPNGLTTPAPIDEQSDLGFGSERPGKEATTIEHIYAGDLMGNIWRFDVAGNSPKDWFIRFEKRVDGEAKPQPLFGTWMRGISQPITARPDVMRNPLSPGWIVTFGTGQYFSVEHTDVLEDNPVQSVYGLIDLDEKVSKPTEPYKITGNEAYQRSIFQVVEKSIDTDQDGKPDSTVQIRLTTDDPEDPKKPNSKAGEDKEPMEWKYINSQRAIDGKHFLWYMDLINPKEKDSGGERIITRPRLRAGRLLISSMVPGTNACLAGGTGWTMELDAKDGSRPRFTPIDLNGDGNFTQEDQIKVDEGTYISTSARQTTVGMSGTPLVITIDSQKELHLHTGPGGNTIELTTGNTGSLDRRRTTWQNLMR